MAQPSRQQPLSGSRCQAVELSAVFASDASNSAGARDEYECCWLFKHIDSDGRSGDWLEKGWHVNHFFPRPDKYEVTAGTLLTRRRSEADYGSRTSIVSVAP